MKYIYLTSIIVTSAFTVSAQIKIGPRIGVNLSNVKTDVSTTTTNIFTSYSIGATLEKSIGEAVAVQLNVLASQKGYDFIDVDENKNTLGASNSLSFSKSSVVTSRGTRKFFYLDIPIALLYKKDLGIGKVIAGAGAYYASNFWGVSEEKNTYVVGSSGDLSLSSIEGTYDLKKSKELSSSDFGLLATAGLEFNEKVQLSFTYNLGLADIDPGKAKTQNRVVNVSLVYFIKR